MLLLSANVAPYDAADVALSQQLGGPLISCEARLWAPAASNASSIPPVTPGRVRVSRFVVHVLMRNGLCGGL
jgi:hypothetical protein